MLSEQLTKRARTFTIRTRVINFLNERTHLCYGALHLALDAETVINDSSGVLRLIIVAGKDNHRHPKEDGILDGEQTSVRDQQTRLLENLRLRYITKQMHVRWDTLKIVVANLPAGSDNHLVLRQTRQGFDYDLKKTF